MTEKIILDSWAVLAWLQGEPSGAVIRDLLEWAEGDEDAGVRAKRSLIDGLRRPKLLINIINLGEVFYLIGRRKGEQYAQETIDEIRTGPIEIVPATDDLVLKAASLKIKHTIAYADAFAVATAIAKDGKLISGDPELRALKETTILWLGKRD
ncbi:MAG: type II toxin-antitoxin system VapC family toxin [Deltaproteobacteria bacterium]|nr:type II toxin-antitoxin system VapC family toxin [Deltaproteobacteria bacterium]